MKSEKNIRAIVLAAGKGVRMKSDLPKVLHPLAGKPLVVHVMENLKKAGISDTLVIVGYRGDMVSEVLGSLVKIAWQREQLGTGHAVMQAEESFRGFSGNVIIACGDVPLLGAPTFGRLIEMGKDPSVRAVVITMELDNPFGYGRIIKDAAGNLERIVEEKDATEDERNVREVNTGTYLFDSRILFEGLKTIGTDNAQKEYYLPDVLKHVRDSGFTVKTLLLDNPVEGSGINSNEELKKIEDIVAGRGAGDPVSSAANPE